MHSVMLRHMPAQLIEWARNAYEIPNDVEVSAGWVSELLFETLFPGIKYKGPPSRLHAHCENSEMDINVTIYVSHESLRDVSNSIGEEFPIWILTVSAPSEYRNQIEQTLQEHELLAFSENINNERSKIINKLNKKHKESVALMLKDTFIVIAILILMFIAII